MPENVIDAVLGIAADDVGGPRRNEARANVFVYMIRPT
jgi:hypothetical protein